MLKAPQQPQQHRQTAAPPPQQTPINTGFIVLGAPWAVCIAHGVFLSEDVRF